MSKVRSHYHQVIDVLAIVLVLNILVAAAKIVYGLIARSSSMTADGFHSLSDGTSNIVGIVGIAIAMRPRDKDHPYGHKKYETLCALGIAGMLFFVAFNLAKEGIGRMIAPVMPQIDETSFIVMLVTLLVNVFVMTYERRRGIMLRSDVLVADAMHTKADIMTSFSVIVALLGVKMGFPILDPIATIVISAFIVHTAIGIVRQEAGILCDEVAITDVEGVEGVIRSFDGVRGCHGIRSRGRPDDVHLDVHVQVDGTMSLQEAHLLSHRIEAGLKGSFPGITDVLVHIEPRGQ
ncbi:MAG: cation transporter [Elusimicrobia bacterium]|nr:cation transporter [Elusimicrobiota bacterium]